MKKTDEMREAVVEALKKNMTLYQYSHFLGEAGDIRSIFKMADAAIDAVLAEQAKGETQIRICNGCKYRVEYYNQRNWCYMFVDMMPDCQKFKSPHSRGHHG